MCTGLTGIKPTERGLSVRRKSLKHLIVDSLGESHGRNDDDMLIAAEVLSLGVDKKVCK